MKTIIRLNAAVATVAGRPFDKDNARDQKSAADLMKVALFKQA